MTLEEDEDRQKATVLARHLDATVIAGISSTFAGNAPAAIEAWDRALTLGLALESLPLADVDPILQTTAARLAAWEDTEEEVPGSARLLRRHRAPGRARRPLTALHRVVASCGRACATALVTEGLAESNERLVACALGAMLAPGRPPPANAGAVRALASRQKVDWETSELLKAALG